MIEIFLIIKVCEYNREKLSIWSTQHFYDQAQQKTQLLIIVSKI